MKIFTAEQLVQADQATLEIQNISSLELMERAASLAFSEIMKPYKNKVVSFHVFCGIGNNGGDGLVIARKILEFGYEVKVWVVEYSSNPSEEFTANLNRLKESNKTDIEVLNATAEIPILAPDAVVIDCIFGIGLNRSLPDWVNRLINQLNQQNLHVIAIDIPSGMYPNKVGATSEHILRAQRTLTFQSPKLCFYLPQTAEYAGEITVLNIGLDTETLNGLETKYELIEAKALSEIRHTRTQFSHKGTFGHALLIGGSYGMMGSMVLATKAALRAGSGKVTSMIPRCGVGIIQSSAPEAMVLTAEGTDHLAGYESPNFETEVICFGMGARTRQDTADFFLDVMKSSERPMLIDADGLNLLSQYKVLQEFVPEYSVLTPHPKELERLLGSWDDDLDKIQKAKNFSKKHKIVLLIKGAHTLVVTPSKIFINSTGNPGMATAGSGDVLSGLISGLMAQGYNSEQAAIMGVWLHGKAGDIALKKSSVEALIAGDLIANFGEAFQELEKT